MNTRLLQRVSVTCLVQNIRLRLGKINEYGDRFADEALNLGYNVALELAAVDSRAYRAHLFGCVSHRNEKHVLVLRRKGHGGKDKLLNVRCLRRVRTRLCRFKLSQKSRYQAIESNHSSRR